MDAEGWIAQEGTVAEWGTDELSGRLAPPLDALAAIGWAEVSTDVCESFQHRGWLRRDFTLALGLSCTLHGLMLALSILAGTFSIPLCAVDMPFVTASLVELAAPGAEGGGGFPTMAGEGSAPCIGATEPQTPEPAEEFTEPAVEVSQETVPQPKREKPIRLPEKPHLPKRKASPPRRTNPTPAAETVDQPAAEALSRSAPQGEGGTGPEGAAAGSSSGGAKGEGTGAGSRGDGVSGELDARQVDVPPTPTRKVEPEFPLLAKRMGINGRVVLKLLVKKDGSVGKATVIEAAPDGIFEESALEAIRKWRFNPGQYRGAAVATWVVQPIQFRLFR